MAVKAITDKYIYIVSAGEKLAGLTKNFLQFITNIILNLNNIDDKLTKSAHHSCGSCFHVLNMQSESRSENNMGKRCSKTLFCGTCRAKEEDIREEYFRLMAAGISEATNTDTGMLEPPAIEMTEFPPGSIDQLHQRCLLESKLQNMDLKLMSCENFLAETNTGDVDIAVLYFLYSRFVYVKECMGLSRLNKKERNCFKKIQEKKDLLEEMVFKLSKEYNDSLSIEDFRQSIQSQVIKMQTESPKATGDISHTKQETFVEKRVTVAEAGVTRQMAANKPVETAVSLDGMGENLNTLKIDNLDNVSNHTSVNTSFDDITTPLNKKLSKFGFRRLITSKAKVIERSKMKTKNLVKPFGKLQINSPDEEQNIQKKDNEAILKESVRSASCEREIRNRKKRTPFRRSKKLPTDAISSPPDTKTLAKVKPTTENSGVDDVSKASRSHPPPLPPPPSGPGVSVSQDKTAHCQTSSSSPQNMNTIPTECSKQVIEEMKQMVSKIRTESFVNGKTVADIELKTFSKKEEPVPTRSQTPKCQKHSGLRQSKIPLLVGSTAKLQTHIKPEIRDSASESIKLKPATTTPVKTGTQVQLPIDPKFKLVSQKQNKPENSIPNPEISNLSLKSKVGNNLENRLESAEPASQNITDTQSQISTPGEIDRQKEAAVTESKILEPKSPQPPKATGNEPNSPCNSQKTTKTEEKANASDGSPMNKKSNGAAETVTENTPPKLREKEPVRYLSRKQRRLLEAKKSPDTRPSRHAPEPQTPPHRLISIQALESPDKNNVDVTAHLQTNATVDYSSYTIEPQHGSRPNKKKLKEEIKQKTKTRGMANKHLKRCDGAVDHILDDFDSPTDKSFEIEVSDDEAEQQLQQDQEQSFEHAQKEEIISAVDQVTLLDDREYNMVAQEVLRKEDDRLRDLEEQYSVCGKNKEKDKKKRKEKKHKRQILPLV